MSGIWAVQPESLRQGSQRCFPVLAVVEDRDHVHHVDRLRGAPARQIAGSKRIVGVVAVDPFHAIVAV